MDASWFENFKNNFYDIEDLKGHAEMIAIDLAMNVLKDMASL
ncbi:hypothetical protein P4388_25170 [Bacillus thuringiensis]|nr:MULTISPECIES: hypothetical protein [Bacillus cereus group]MDA2615435.1 hypothetical protein [Bacillus cereus]MEB8555432.1 hypothetical protein [Bacillus cereus]MEB8728115.1 hypothetical protein [Bacillus cereus]MEB8820395.1 hypothetical protein [Bacillus cereus]MEB8975603.1 hypothetical protein [Bacillus cereus]